VEALLRFLSHDWAGLALAACLVAPALWVTRSTRRRWQRLGAYGVLGAGMALAAGAAYHCVHMALVHREFPVPGKLVDVGGYRLHVLAEGEAHGRATVVWLPGAHEAGYALYHLHAAMRREARSILVDRPGSGWSDPGPFPRTTEGEAEEVASALSRAGEKGPFVFAGHSFGGLLAANIARRHPEIVAAVVLVDATPPDAINYAPPNPYLVAMRWDALLMALSRLFGVHHDTIARLTGGGEDPEARRVGSIMARRLGPNLDAMEAVEDTAATGLADYSSFAELQRGGLGWENTVYDGELGSLPVYLVAPVGIPGFDAMARVMYVGGGGERRLGPEAAYHERLRQFWDRSRERYIQVSSHVERVYAAAGASHNFPYEDPDLVVGVVRRALAEHPPAPR
jgi:pimeloyl-ACP methyl ester carboxylesterase